MKKIYSIVGTVFILGSIWMAVYFFNLTQRNEYPFSIYNWILVAFPLILGLLYVTIPSQKINKSTNSSLVMLLVGIVVSGIFTLVAMNDGGGGLLWVILAVVGGAAFVLISIVLFLMGRFGKV
jgi:hypothetical protein